MGVRREGRGDPMDEMGNGTRRKGADKAKDATPKVGIGGVTMARTHRRMPDAIKDALVGMRRSLSLTIWSVVTIALSLFLVGAFVVTDMVVGDALGSVEDEVTIYAYVDDDAAQEDIDSVMDGLRGVDGVKDVSFVTKDQAWEDYRKSMGEESADKALAALDGVNPLPASIVVTMDDANDVPAMADHIADDEGFAKVADGGTVDGNVTYGKQQVGQLLSFTNTVRIAMFAFVTMLVGVACVLVSNTIRNSIASRGEEIGIMRLVGASKAYIRRPFVYEGVMQSAIGAAIAVILLIIMQLAWLPRLSSAISFIHIDIPTWQYAVIYLCVTMLGVAIGVASAEASMRKHLCV